MGKSTISMFIYIFSGWCWWCNNDLEKYEFVNGMDDIRYVKWTIKVMFETTNQIYSPKISIYTLFFAPWFAYGI